MDESELSNRILKSDAFASLQLERKLTDILGALNWDATHGYYYVDLKTEKAREIDVFATQLWIRNLKRGQQIIRLKVAIEAKSAKDFHILFSPFSKANPTVLTHQFWLGYEENYGELARELHSKSLDDKQVKKSLSG